MLSLLCCLLVFSLGLTLDAPAEAQVPEVQKLCGVIRSLRIQGEQKTDVIDTTMNLKVCEVLLSHAMNDCNDLEPCDCTA